MDNLMSVEKLNELLEKHAYAEIRMSIAEMYPVDLAELLSELPENSLLLVFRLLPKETAADTFAEMEPEQQEKLLEGFNDAELKAVLNEMYVDDAVDMLEEMPANVVKRVLSKADPATRKEINQILQYPDDSAGAVMTTEFVNLKEEMTVSEAIAWIRKNGDDKEDIYTCYVISPNRTLKGIVTVRELLLSKSDAPVRELMETNIISVHTLDDRETAAKLFDKYNLTALPVIDQENRLVGIITVDDALDVLQEENTEDFERMAAMSPKQDDYFGTSVLQHVKNRLPWLLILMFTSVFTGMIIEKYEVTFAMMPVLVALMPMLSDSGGNCGSQTSTLVIRGMALDEISLKDFGKVVWKEFRVALLVGIALAVCNGVRIWIQYKDLKLALIIAVSLIMDVIMAKIMGAVLPMLAKKLKLDPAIMASPLLTTVVDVGAVWIYFEIASRVLGLK